MAKATLSPNVSLDLLSLEDNWSDVASPGLSETIDNGCKFTARLAMLYNNAKFSDVTLIVGGKKFYAHKLLLANASDVFEQMLTSEHWPDSGQSQLVLQEQEDCIPVFCDFLKYIYSGQVALSMESVLGLLVLADKYNIPDLKDCCSAFMGQHLVTPPDQNKAITWYQYAIACNSSNLQEACYQYIVLNMDIIIQSPDWIYLDQHNLISLLQRSDLVVESEYVLLQAVVCWLSEDNRLKYLNENLSVILPHIRFPMILPEHLSEFEDSDFEKSNHDQFSPYLLSAYRYHALSIRSKKQHFSSVPEMQFMYRNYTDDNYSIHVDVIRKAFKSCPRVSSKVEKPLSLPVNICNIAQDKLCKMKVTFYPQGYYTTSLWNGQLNLAKSTDFTKMIIAHRGGIELHEAEITILVYAWQKGVKYAHTAITKHHVFETYETYEIENILDLEKLKMDQSPFIMDGALYLKVFVRPISFQKPEP
ncbi:hypothetical protein LSH36_639g01044 [Paralvinella palmiformis]|uniref:BTB domain-containing protein n=1 Tax=Paralvinella palmiformis TaxID=53620 RepID=A0AAD9MW37_9ANNE|nr:hypothetical protein LSH36_639g01044 [Paralvinella palmiformis]